MDNLAKGQLETDVYKVAAASSDGIVWNLPVGEAAWIYAAQAGEEACG